MSIQTKVGWRAYSNPSASNVSSLLLDTYSGAAAAYSLRRLTTAYTGSAIRVRRSSDNTELNIGFDTNGDLDTVALSSFVGSGNGFVTTWYDQSGNSINVTQATANSQPLIVSSGSIMTKNGKPVIDFTWGQFLRAEQRVIGLNQTSIFNIFSIKSLTDRNFAWDIGNLSGSNQLFAFDINTWGTSGQKFGLYASAYGFDSNAPTNLNQNLLSIIANNSYYVNISSNTSYYINNTLRTLTNTGAVHPSYSNANRITIGNTNSVDYYFNGTHQEFIVYQTNQSTNRSGIESNINSYYSTYPNPTSVWNLLAAAYNADTKSLPSLKTSLVAAYNGESNANDSFGTNNGTAQGGLTYTAGKIGNAFQFNGTNAYVQLPNTSNQFNFTGDFSISLWINLASLTGVQFLFNNFKQLGLNNYYGYTLFAYNNYIYFRINNGTLSDYDTITPFSSTNTWANIVVTRKTSVTNKIYINGVLVVSGGAINPVYDSVMPYSRIGSYNDSNGDKFLANGSKIDAVSTWNKELTQSEITELYNSGNGAQYIGDNFYKPTTNDALNTYNGTAQGGLTYTPGKIGTAFNFNGTNAYVQLGDVMDVGTSSWSYSMWFNANILTTGNYMSLFSKSIAAEGTGRVGCSTYGNKLQFFFSPVFSGSSLILIETNTTFSTSTWYNITLIIDRADKIKIYSNGNLLAVTSLYSVNNLTPYSSTNYNTNHPFRIGSYTSSDNTTPTSLFNGQIDAFNAWNRVLTQSEITELYNSGNGKQYPN